MLYDMIPERIDRYIFLPFLSDLWSRCDAANGYQTFLELMYPTVYAYEGNIGDYDENEPQSFLYNFVVNEKLIRENELCDLKWPSCISYCRQTEWTSKIIGTYVGADGKQFCHAEPVEINSAIDDEDYIERWGEPEVEGMTWEIDVIDIYSNKERFAKLIAFIEDDSFPLKQEYNAVRKYTEELNQRINSKSKSDDWFDDF